VKRHGSDRSNLRVSSVTAKMPLLGPGAEALTALLGHSRAALHEACERRGITLPRAATRAELADALMRDAIRARAEAHYTDHDRAFISVDDENPFLVQLLARRQYRHILEVGCGTGLLAELMRPALSPDARWFGFDIIAAGVARARQRLAMDSRFRFEVGDAETVQPPRGVDCVFMAWLIPWLNTHGVYRMVHRLATRCLGADVVCAVPFLPCVRRMEGAPPPTDEEIATAHAYLEGRPSRAAERWDLRRFELARWSLEQFYSISETHVIPTACMVWVGRPTGMR
jgi:SAM-dependent methyltransferase